MAECICVYMHGDHRENSDVIPWPPHIFLYKARPGIELTSEEENSRIVSPKDPSISSSPSLGITRITSHLAFSICFRT